MTIEEYVNKRVNEEDDLRGLAKELLRRTKMLVNTDKIYNIMLIWKDRNVKNPEDPTDEWLVRDLLCDLKHFCDEYAIDFDSELSRANNLYLKENNND
jgi:hypothetical protein